MEFTGIGETAMRVSMTWNAESQVIEKLMSIEAIAVATLQLQYTRSGRNQPTCIFQEAQTRKRIASKATASHKPYC